MSRRLSIYGEWHDNSRLREMIRQAIRSNAEGRFLFVEGTKNQKSERLQALIGIPVIDIDHPVIFKISGILGLADALTSLRAFRWALANPKNHEAIEYREELEQWAAKWRKPERVLEMLMMDAEHMSRIPFEIFGYESQQVIAELLSKQGDSPIATLRQFLRKTFNDEMKDLLEEAAAVIPEIILPYFEQQHRVKLLNNAIEVTQERVLQALDESSLIKVAKGFSNLQRANDVTRELYFAYKILLSGFTRGWLLEGLEHVGSQNVEGPLKAAGIEIENE